MQSSALLLLFLFTFARSSTGVNRCHSQTLDCKYADDAELYGHWRETYSVFYGKPVKLEKVSFREATKKEIAKYKNLVGANNLNGAMRVSMVFESRVDGKRFYNVETIMKRLNCDIAYNVWGLKNQRNGTYVAIPFGRNKEKFLVRIDKYGNDHLFIRVCEDGTNFATWGVMLHRGRQAYPEFNETMINDFRERMWLPNASIEEK